MANIVMALTPKGEQKLVNVVQALREQAAISLASHARRLRAMAAADAPSEREEAEMLSRGEISGSDPLSGANIGTPDDGRFIRQGSQVPMREAIATDEIRVERLLFGNRILVSTGSPTRINPRTGFFWMTRRRGIQGPTEPFNHALLQAMEFGGMTWIVVPRGGRHLLEPEPGVTAHEMLKTLPPRQMYGRNIAAERQSIVANVAQDCREAVRIVGLV